ncbi:hypothetical protein Patl1_24245 [Pistacia atlantica]|uniref:Uncharacterized protein n=1 Tax=Pistacia atlantica TaxID=434234 RepID=A0ACC1A263_9ROSI|nr:hypothetical protein Patl1_24245 [Pistacia atlantica]
MLLHMSSLILLVLLVAQTEAQATTAPNEVRALNIIFEKWGISANQNHWNISGDPCSGAAIDDSIAIDADGYNPFIKCDCSYNKNTLCHIIEMRVYALEVDGMIPEELWSLNFLIKLDEGQNLLSGPLSPSVRNLRAVKYLSHSDQAWALIYYPGASKRAWHAFELVSPSIGPNNFSGPVPPELGNLSKLEHLYMGTNSFSGPLPSELGHLMKLKTLWAFDIELTGRIPDFIGNWSNLATLRFQGNSFEGPIPSSFSNLTSLKELRISDLSNGSSSLAFIRNMKSLTILELRNNKISGSIPYDINHYWSLQYLFLGNNRLTGTLPTYKSGKLLNINLVANNFTLEGNNRQARIAASSLGYYGLGLENGNHSVTLKFAEIADPDTTGRRSFGRRVFDIYIQGNRVEKDFDIKRVAGGVPRRAVQREYIAKISENYLEIHFFSKAGKELVCIPTDDFKPTVRPPSGPSPTTKKNLIVGIIVGVGVVSLLLLAVFFIVQRRRQQTNDDGKSIDLCYH